MGRDKFWHAVKGYYYHPDLLKTAAKITQECEICQRFKVYSRGGQPVMERAVVSPYDQYALDVLQLEQATNGLKYLVVGIDMASRFVHAVPVRDKTARTVSRAVEERILPALPRIPVSVLTDNGKEFTGGTFSDLLTKYGIKHHTSVPYLGHTNGRVERVNRSLLTSLATTCTQSGRAWPEELPRVLVMLNHAKHKTTGKAPVEHFGIGEAKLPVPSKKCWKEETKRFKPFTLGDLVAWRLPDYQTRNKLAPRYSAPHSVVKVDRRGLVYDIEDEHGVSRRAHYEQLKKWYGPWRGKTIQRDFAADYREPEEGENGPIAAKLPVSTSVPEPGAAQPAWIKALLGGLQSCVQQAGPWRDIVEQQLSVPADQEELVDPLQQLEEIVVETVPSAQQKAAGRTGTKPKNPRHPSLQQPAVTTRAMHKRIDFWSVDPESIDEQLPSTVHELPQRQNECDFERFEEEQEVVASTPRRNIRRILTRTILDPNTDGSDNDSELREEDCGYVDGVSEEIPKNSSVDPSSPIAPMSEEYYHLTLSEFPDEDAALLTGHVTAENEEQPTSHCSPDCWCRAYISSATAGSSPRFSP
jgi:transposase InsO family protein